MLLLNCMSANRDCCGSLSSLRPGSYILFSQPIALQDASTNESSERRRGDYRVFLAAASIGNNKKINAMGSSDSKLNFRKAVIQLTTKTQVGHTLSITEQKRRRTVHASLRDDASINVAREKHCILSHVAFTIMYLACWAIK